MPLGNVLSNFGLMAEGSDAATRSRQAITAGDQSNQLGAQKVQEGAMGLEDATRVRADDASARTAAQNAAAAGRTSSGTFLDMAKAYRARGDVLKASQFEQAAKTSEENGAKEWVHELISVNPQPGERPDIVQIMNRYERTKDVTGATFDAHGNLTITKADGKVSPPVNVGVLAERMGLVKPPTIHNVPAGGVGILTGAGIDSRKPENQITTPKTFPEHPKEGYITKTKKDADGNEVQQIIDVREKLPDGKPNQNYGKEVAQDGSTASPPNIDKHLPALKEVSHAISQLPGMSTTDPADLTGATKVLTPEGRNRMSLANQIYMANRGIDPRTLALMATTINPDPKAGEIELNKTTGEARVKYNGQWFKINSPRGENIQTPAQKPAPKAESAKPAAPAPAPKAATPVSTEEDRLPEVAEVPSRTSPKEKFQSRVSAAQAESKKTAEAAPKKRAAETFRVIAKSPRMTTDDISLIKEGMDSGLLTPAEMAKGQRMLDKLEPSSAGKISKDGLGG